MEPPSCRLATTTPSKRSTRRPFGKVDGLGPMDVQPLCKQDRAHEPECTSLCANPTIIRENIFRYKPMGLAIKPTALTMFFSLSNCTLRAPLVATKLRFSIWRWTPALRALDLYYKVAIFQPELENCTSRARLALHSCDCPARAETGAQNLYFAYFSCTSKLRSSSQSWKLALHVLYLHYKVAIFQLVQETCTSRTTLVLESCDSPARAGTTKLRLSS